MSLTQHLYRNSPIRDWWLARSRPLEPYVAELARYADVRCAPLAIRGMEHAAQVGGIVGRVLETMVEPAPPYAAILAAGSRRDATWWPTHQNLPALGDEEQAVEWRPTPRGMSHLVPTEGGASPSRELHAVAKIETDPAATLEQRSEAAATVAAFETMYRSHADEAVVSGAAIADAVAILDKLRVSYQHAAYLCDGQIRGHAAPVFAPHWADGDVLLGPGRTGGYGLVDVKTVGGATLANAERARAWLWQLLSYAAADAAEDLWQVRAVGVWLPRQDALTMWPLERMWRELGADPAELARLLREAYEADWRAAQRLRR